MSFIRLLLLMLFIISPLSIAANQTYVYGPKVTLSGVIIKLTFPGRPNYESIKNGDEAERGPYIILDQPIDAKSSSKEAKAYEDPKNNVKLVQLVVTNQADWKYMKNGNYVKVTGDLFSSQTGHHHARLLITVDKIDVISKKPVSIKSLNKLGKEDKQFINLNHLSKQ